MADKSKGIFTKGLTKRFGKRLVVKGVDLSVKPGEVVGLLGPNGAGKTTSFYMVVGLVPATSGRVFLNSEEVTELPMYKRARMGIGYLPQEASIFRRLTVRENLKAIAETLNFSKSDEEALVEERLEDLHLTHLAEQKAFTLSGGERRRLEISRALVTSPDYLLMDEPFSGVDPINVADVQQIILKLKGKGIGVLITDHNVRETLSIVDRAYLIHEGAVLHEGTADSLINDPESRKFYLGENFDM